LKLNEEYEQIREGITSAKFGSQFDLRPVLAADLDRLIFALLEQQPNIVHFSGHGTSEEELLLQPTPDLERRLRDLGARSPHIDVPHRLGKDPFIEILGAIKEHVRIVVLNACHSAKQAEAIANVIDWVVGMSSAVGDESARIFSVAFYVALAFGRPVETAFGIAKAKLAGLGLPDKDLPRLYKRQGVDGSKPFLATAGGAETWPSQAQGRFGNGLSAARQVVLRVGGSSSRLECHFRRGVDLGRSEGCDVTLVDALDDVGNSHARLGFNEPRRTYEITDLESVNGTYVNGQRLGANQTAELKAGDEIRLGRSLRLLYRPQGGGEEACAALVELGANGRESNCYVIAPRNRVLVGNGEGCVARISPSLLPEGEILGAVEWTPAGIQFSRSRDGTPAERTPLEDGGEVNFPRLTLRVKIPRKSEDGTPSATIRYEPQGFLSGSPQQKEVKKPDSNELPPWIRRLNLVLGLFGLILLPLALYVLRPAPLTSEVDGWFRESRESVVSGSDLVWAPLVKQERRKWPPEGPVQACIVAPRPSLKAYGIDAERLIASDRLGVVVDDVPNPLDLDEARYWKNTDAELDQFKNQGLLLIVFQQNDLWTGLSLKYYGHYDPKADPDVKYDKRAILPGRYFPCIAAAALAALVLLGTRALAVQVYRRGRLADFEAWQAKQTKETFELKGLLDEARKLSHKGQDARALVLINQVLERRPFYDEAAELKRIIQGGAGAARGTLIAGGPGRDDDPVPADMPNLFLKILQTPYAYRAPRGFDRITLGRQRRREPGEAGATDNDEGNDLVIRVPGSDRLSLRISRKHLEIQRIGKQFLVMDLSKGSTLLNGLELPKGEPHPIVSGDRLTIAGVIVLQVQLQAASEMQIAAKIVEVQHLKGSSFEATIGDMMTELPAE
jgi:pSer/pThr/pTyr-binding forkhead associated (FHA) protein